MDIKITAWYMGNGLASLNRRRIYLFQNKDNRFTKISFLDKLGDDKKPDRDLDGDGNNEIITMNLTYYGDHSYWLFNIYDFIDGELKNVNMKYDYPIMIQYLHRENYEITNKISREKMKEFSLKYPDSYDIRK
jgi:hypothetical protein